MSLAMSPAGDSFAILSLPKLTMTTFTFKTGKIHRQYDESLEATQEMQQAAPTGRKLDDMELGRRLAVERDLERSALEAVQGASTGTVGSAAWSEEGKLLLYPTLLGIKVVNTVTNKVVRLLGRDETVRFTNLALYQGVPKKTNFTSVAMATSDNPLLNKEVERDPTLFCTAVKRGRFYMFTRAEEAAGERDVYNERPTREEATTAAPTAATAVLSRAATIHTTKGDIKVELYADLVPKTIENFVGLARKTYYDGIIFHRVIPKFVRRCCSPHC